MFRNSSQITKTINILCCFLCALGSGSSYVYSAYGPQLGQRLNFNHTEVNIIGSFGNSGTYFTAPFWGFIIDKLGIKIPLWVSSSFLFIGYFGIHSFYAQHLTTNHNLFFISVLSTLVGMGGSGALLSALNATARSFTDKSRATASGIVLAGFGLSAFFYSFIAHEAFPGSTDAFLLALAIGTSISILSGAIGIKVIPSKSKKDPENHNEEQDPLVNDQIDSSENIIASNKNPLSIIPTVDFWILFLTMSLLSGTGLMWINNVGNVIQALFAYHHPHFDPIEVEQAQTKQVSLLSLNNCFGRILIGLTSDVMRRRYNIDRSFWLCVISISFIISQIVAQSIENPAHIGWATSLIGLSYGSLFAMGPVITLEIWGLESFSSNWGILSLAPAIAGPILNILFGRVFDSHSATNDEVDFYSKNEGMLNIPVSSTTCLQGRQCYSFVLHLTTLACFGALILSIFGTLRRKNNSPIFKQSDERSD